MKISRGLTALLAVGVLTWSVAAKTVAQFDFEDAAPRRVKFEDDSSETAVPPPVKVQHLKKFIGSRPDLTEEMRGSKIIRSPHKFESNPSAMAAHPYPYEDTSRMTFGGSPMNSASDMLDTFPYAPSVKPSYIPPILQPTNSKLDVGLGVDPVHHYSHPPHGGHTGLHHGHHQAPWRKLVKILTAVVPIGLFLAALPPNVVHINATQMSKPLAGVQRQRSEAEVQAAVANGGALQTFPVLDLIERLGGLPALEHPGCEAHIFCEMARLGATPAANSVQKTLWSMANETPEPIAELLGARDLLKAIRTDACSIFDCPKPEKSEKTTENPILQAASPSE